MKKGLSFILALILCLSMCACGNNGLNGTNNMEKPTTIPTTSRHTHDWKTASCTKPKTCSTCGETEGSAAGHNWKEANCKTPKTCSTCGKTEGSLGDHVWIDATYTAPKTCSVCGTTRGEPLIPGVTLAGTAFDVDSVGGIKPKIYWRNDSGKTIKYITFTAVPYNAVGDIVASSIGNRTYVNLKITGPIAPADKAFYEGGRYIDNGHYWWVYTRKDGSLGTGTTNGSGDIPKSEYNKIFDCSYFDPVWYNNTIHRVVITKIYVEYMDGTTETIENPTNNHIVFAGNGAHDRSRMTTP